MKKKRWVPKKGQRYFRVLELGGQTAIADCTRWSNNEARYEINCFRTRREALAAAKKIRRILANG